MKRSTEADFIFVAGLFSAKELEVSCILPQLPQLIAAFSSSPVCAGWGAKRKRSALDSNPPRLSLLSGSGASVPSREFEGRSTATKKIVALSPATPLAFLPSESEEKPKSVKRKLSVKKKKQKRVGSIDGLTPRRNLLKRINVELQRVKIKPEFATSKPQSSPAIEGHPWSIQDQTTHAQRSQVKEICHYPSSETSSSSPSTCEFGANDLNLSSLGIPDLNIPLEDSPVTDSSQALDLNMGMAAQARQTSIPIYRLRTSTVPNKPRHHCR